MVTQVGCRGPRDGEPAAGLRVEHYDSKLDAFRCSAEVNAAPKDVQPSKVAAVVAIDNPRRKKPARTYYQMGMSKVTDQTVGGNLAPAVRCWVDLQLSDLGAGDPGPIRSE